MTRIISIDSGKDSTKVCVSNLGEDEIREMSFPTRIEPYSELASGSLELTKAHHLKNADFDVMIGSSSLANGTTDSNSKNDDIHKIAIMFAIASNVDNGDIVNVVVGCPLSEYIDKDKRNAYKNAVLPRGQHSVYLDGSPKTFTIEKRMVIPEATGILYTHPELLDDDCAVIDIGGLNMNAIQFCDRQAVVSTKLTLKYGSVILYHALRTALAEANEDIRGLRDDQVEKAIKKGYVNRFREVTEPVIKAEINKHLDLVIKNCSGSGWENFKTLTLIFIGGTSALLHDAILEKYPDAIVFDPEESRFINARGFHQILKRKIEND